MMNKSQDGFSSVLVVMLLVLVSLTGFVGWKTLNSSNSANNEGQEDKPAIQTIESLPQTLQHPKTKQAVEIDESAVYEVVLVDTTYWGYLIKINDSYIALTNVYYQRPSTSTLTELGNELHGPESVMFINTKNITDLIAIKNDSDIRNSVLAQLGDIKPLELASTSVNINNHIKTSQYQALFIKGGTSYYAKVSSLDGDFLKNSGTVFTLNAIRASGPQPQISLELVEPGKLPAVDQTSLLYWENLKADGQITQAIEEYLKNR